MRMFHVLFAVIIVSASCKNKSTELSQQSSSENSAYLSKDQIVEAFARQGSSRGFSAGMDQDVPVDPDTGLPFHLISSEDMAKFFGEAAAVSHEALSLTDSDVNGTDVDLRQWATPVKHQGASSLCTAFSAAGAMELLAKMKTNKDFDLSEKYLWSLYQEETMEGPVRAASRNKIAEEAVWPFNSARPVASKPGIMKISKFGASLNVKGMITALQNRKPVLFGSVAPRFGRDGVVSGTLGGLHAMLLVGAQFNKRVSGGGYFIVKNSYGPRMGDKGYLYMPFGYCNIGSCVGRAIEDVTIDGVSSEPANARTNSNIKLAIGSSIGDSDTYEMWISAPKEATRVAFCTAGEPAGCKPGVNGYTTATLQRSVGDRAIFKADRSLAVSQGLRIAVVSLASNGNMTASASLAFERN